MFSVSLIEQLGTRGPCSADRALGNVVMDELKAAYPLVFEGVELSDDAEPRIGRLSFYKRYALVELPVYRGRGPESVFALHIPKSDREPDEETPSTIWLNGSSESIYRADDAEAIELGKEHALDYLRFFVNFLRGEDLPFTLLDAKEVTCSVEKDMTATEQFELVATRERFMSGTLCDAWETLRVIPSGYEARFPIAYGTDFADLAKFTICNKGDDNGMVQIIVTTWPRPVGALSVLAIPAFRRISATVLEARRDMIPASRKDPEALGRRLADAKKLGEAGSRREDQEDDDAEQHYDEAIELLHKIVFDYVHILGPDHPDTIIALTCLEYWKIMRNWPRQDEGYGENSLRDVRRLLATQMRSLGSFHPRTLNTRRNIALMLARSDGRSSSDADDAVEHWDRTGLAAAIAALEGLIADIREHLSEDPPDDLSQLDEILVDSQLSLAYMHHEMYAHDETKDDEVAIEGLKRLLAAPQSALPAVTKALSDAHYWLAEYLFGVGRVDEAIAESQARLADLRAVDSPDEREIGYSKKQLDRFETSRDSGSNERD